MGLIRLKGLILKILYAGGGKRIRTADHLVANQALSQLSYTPKKTVMHFGVRVSARNAPPGTLIFFGGPR